jgi:hypothetical protein
MAVCEWHLHSWDLARALGTDHRPSDPGTLVRAAAACQAAAGGFRQKVEATVAPVVARTRPWETLLSTSGRKP